MSNETTTIFGEQDLNVSFYNNSFTVREPEISVVYIIVGVLVILLSLVSVISNALLVLVIVRTPVLHTNTNAMIVSVGVSEFLAGAFIMPIKSVNLISQDRMFPKSLCDFVEFMSSLTTSSKSLGMLSLSIDRCIAVSHPLQYANCINKPTTVLFICCVWGMGTLFSVLPLLGVGNYSHLTARQNCGKMTGSLAIYPALFEISTTIIPSVIIIVTLVIILVEAKSHHRVIAIAQLAIAMYSGPAAARGINYSRSTFKAMRTYLVICSVYMCTCFPKSVYTVCVIFDDRLYQLSIFTVLTIMFYICCITTPLVISNLNSKFKLSIKTIFKKKNRVIPQVEKEPYTITTGLQSILETSMVFKYVPQKESVKLSRESRDTNRPGPSQEPVVTYTKRKISVLHEVHSSSSSDKNSGSKSVHIQLRKSLSLPM